jgi:hypothetical protein
MPRGLAVKDHLKRQPCDAAEATYYVETLRENDAVAEEPAPLTSGQTHRIETDEEGRRVLRRKRFSAV